MRRDESMTNYEMIKQSSIDELARFLCEEWEACSECPAREFCHYGHNGMKDWLEKECD